MSKVLTGIRLEIVNASGDLSSPRTEISLTYNIEDSVDSELAKTKMVTKTVTPTESLNTIWSGIKSDIETDEEIS